MYTHTGGAVEMILIGGIVVRDTDGQSQWYTILGYLFLLGNTLCMVRYVLWVWCLGSCDV